MLLTAPDFENPAIRLSGTVDYEMYSGFREQLDRAKSQELLVIVLSTLGGDPEVARMMGEDVRFASERTPSRPIIFLGKAAIYSAGTTFMSFFHRDNRYLTRGTRLMIHERKIIKELHLDGPLTTTADLIEATLNEIQSSIAIQNEGFANLIIGSSVNIETIKERARTNWYVEAQEAKKLGLIRDVI